MKKLIISIASFFTLQGSTHASSTIKIGLEEVAARVTQSNMLVYENALKVYQAKAHVEKARGDLLPHLNLWSLAKLIIEPSSIVDQVTDIAPFLVPANWFRLEETRLLYLAEREGARALWGNELHSAKVLYRNLLMDQELLKELEATITELESIHRLIKTREAFGGAKPGTSREIEIRLLGLKEDREKLKVLIQLEFDELTYALGYDSNTHIELKPVELLNVEELHPLEPKGFEFRLLSSSPERRQFEHFFSVLGMIKKEIQYSFFGISEVSRGVAGGVFDSIPIPKGLGGKNASLKVLDAQAEIMRSQQRGIEETLKRQLRALSFQYNSDLGNYLNLKLRETLSRESQESLLRRLKMGEPTDPLEIYETSRNLYLARISLMAVQFRLLNSSDRLQRLILDGDYAAAPPLIESLKGGAL